MITVSHDGEAPHEPKERCCFCRTPTNYWFVPKDVAVCQTCARAATADDVPSKRSWCRRERIAESAYRRATTPHNQTP